MTQQEKFEKNQQKKNNFHYSGLKKKHTHKLKYFLNYF